MCPCGNLSTDTNTDPSCGTIMNPDMTISSNFSPDVTMALGGNVGLSDSMGPAAAWFPGLQMTLGGCPDPGQ